ncbi:MAG: glycosyltransferase [Candidatus Marinimicrobia bacterium]|nr:glycosyltransferase [Candidatus Neomarinimicrobiota bacterium]
MKLLIITQKIDKNDDVLGFFHKWVEEFSRHTEKIYVISQFVGDYDLPANVEVFSLGKERGFSKIRQLFNFYKLLFKVLPKCSKVFVHMIPLWVVLGDLVFKIYKKEVYLWYTHKSVNLVLRLAEKIVVKIFTASKESFRLPSKKVVITRHGIDTDKFKIKNLKSQINSEIKNSKFKIITVGRIAPAKNIDLLIGVGEALKKEGVEFEIDIAGKPAVEKDEIYFGKLKKLVNDKNLSENVKFVGSIPYSKIEEFYQKGDLFVNLSSTGSVDKAVLEAMSCGLDVLVANEAFFGMLPEENISKNKDIRDIVDKMVYLRNNPNKERGLAMRNIVTKHHSLQNLASLIIQKMEG